MKEMKAKLYFSVIIFVYLFFYISVAYATNVKCITENNESVDWYILYKMPKNSNSNNLIKNGVAHVYLTSKNYTQWIFSKYSINDTNSALGNTLKSYYKNMSDVLHVFYNDQPPNKPSNPLKGHTKGVILADVTGGLWLIHSVPHFPQLVSTYRYPLTGVLKGQSFLCISMDLKNLNKVGVQLQYNQPQIYSNHIPAILEAKLSEISKAANGEVVQQPPWFNQISLSSIEKTSFISFAKSDSFGKELYEDWVAPTLQSNLLVETWLNGDGRLPSNCSKRFKVFNVRDVTVQTVNVTFNSTHDHSKWTVSQNSSWTCIGDINRMQHQKLRGGGTVCLYNQSLAKIYKECVKEIEKCSE